MRDLPNAKLKTKSYLKTDQKDKDFCSLSNEYSESKSVHDKSFLLQ